MLACFWRTAPFGAAVVISAMTVTSCYSTIPARTAPPAGAELVLDMTPAATEKMGGFLGRGTISVRGRLLSWQPDSIVVAVLATEVAQGDEQLWRGERVAVPRDAVARLTERRVNRGRTSLAIFAGVAFVVTAVGIISGGVGGTSGGGTKPVPQ